MSAYYEELLRGSSPAHWAGWGDAQAHAARFEAALDGVDRDASATLLDLGCGTGELYAWLARTGRALAYTGVDAFEPAIARARRRHPGGRFVHADLFAYAAPADLVVAVGTLISGASLTSDGVRYRRLRELVERAFALARRRATLIVLDQDVVQARPLLRAEPALGGARRAELHQIAAPLTARYAIADDFLPTDLALTLWRVNG